ncbi:MAG TPA: hypothetical protein VEM36_03365 [Xanthobacteraceae bacterium]|nr:hypothetical protein [Xanthobacteraceae bacterium]
MADLILLPEDGAERATGAVEVDAPRDSFGCGTAAPRPKRLWRFFLEG